MKMLFVTDDIRYFNYKKDTTLAMMWAAQDLDCQLFNCQITDLLLQQGKAYAQVNAVTVAKKPDNFCTLSGKQEQSLTDFDVIVMRKDPPFNMRYIYATYVLEAAQRAGVLVINRPQSLRDCNEKLFATQFSQFMTPTLVSSQQAKIKAFIAEQDDVIVKPLDGMGGSGIFRLQAASPNIGATLEMLTQNQTLPIMAQRFIPDIVKGDKRILVVHGKAADYCLARIPAKGETRGNIAAGGTGVVQPLTEKDKKIAQAIAPVLLKKGLYFVGLDVIGEYVTEINVTSPTCIQEIDRDAGTHIAQDFIKGIFELKANSDKSIGLEDCFY